MRVSRFGLVLLGAAVAMFAAGGAMADDDGTISAGKLAKDAKKFYGKNVTVRAEVEDVFDDHTFSLDEDALLGGADVLVLVPRGLTSTLRKDDVVTVSGVVRPYVVADLDRDFEFFDEGKIINRETKVEFKTRPVLIADSIMSASGSQLITGGVSSTTTMHPGTLHSGTASTDQTMATGDMISAGKLAKDAKKFYGRTVTVRAEVEDVIDPHSFTLEEDSLFAGPDVLVLVPKGVVSNLRHDDVVIVTGTVRPYVMADLEKDYDFFKDGKIFKRETKVDFETRPVLVADSIRTAAGNEIVQR